MKAILTAAFLASLTSASFAEAICVPTSGLSDFLKNGYGEVPVVTGMYQVKDSPSLPFTIFSNPQTGSFTMMSMGPDKSCSLVSGSDLELLVRGDPT